MTHSKIVEIIKTTADLIQHHRGGSWCYENGVIANPLWQYQLTTKDQLIHDKVHEYYNRAIGSTGEIKNYVAEDYTLDDIQPAFTLIDLHQETQDPRYLKVIHEMLRQLSLHYRTEEGNFWHKKIYPYQVWLDGLYMALPFLGKAAKLGYLDPLHFEGGADAVYCDIHRQVKIAIDKLRDPKTGLFIHAYDESRKDRWADKVTGQSSYVWSRAVGWFFMAMCDLYEVMPKPYQQRLAATAAELTEKLLSFQDPTTHLWHQILGHSADPRNYIETSGSAMFIASALKAIRLGIADKTYQKDYQRAFDSLYNHYIMKEGDHIAMTQICEVAGLGRYASHIPYRDGSFEYYMSEPVVSDDPKGLGPLILSYNEIVRIEQEKK